jgi:hypothetical protein
LQTDGVNDEENGEQTRDDDGSDDFDLKFGLQIVFDVRTKRNHLALTTSRQRRFDVTFRCFVLSFGSEFRWKVEFSNVFSERHCHA